MSHRIRISTGAVSMDAELNETGAARAIWDALPIEQNGSTWGDEIYFSIPVEAESNDPVEVVNMGDIGYWPPGNAFCIFYGPTPSSQGSEIRPASAVEVIGHLLGEATDFRRFPDGGVVKIEKIED